MSEFLRMFAPIVGLPDFLHGAVPSNAPAVPVALGAQTRPVLWDPTGESLLSISSAPISRPFDYVSQSIWSAPLQRAPHTLISPVTAQPNETFLHPALFEPT